MELRGDDELEVEMILDIEVREHEKLQSQPQGVVTQEPTSLEMFVEDATQMEVSEQEVETIPDLNLGVFTMTPEQSQDTELVEGELQQQENVEFDQNVFTQEPTSSGNLAETPIQLGTTDLEVCSRDFSLLQGRNGSLLSIGWKGRFLCGNAEKKRNNETRQK